MKPVELRTVMNSTDVAKVKVLTDAEFLDHEDSASILTSVFRFEFKHKYR